MGRYYVYRKGSNAANQSMTQTARVAEVMAMSEDEAVRLAGKRVTVYHNQHLYAEDADQADAEERVVDDKVKILD